MTKQFKTSMSLRSKIVSTIVTVTIGASLLGLASSCTPSVVDPPATNFLYTRADTLAIPKSLDTLYSQMGLDCGCAFNFTVTGTGDTTHIKFVVPKSTTLNSYSIGAFAVGSLPSGSYSSWISFSAKNDDPSGPAYFFDTLHAQILVP